MKKRMDSVCLPDLQNDYNERGKRLYVLVKQWNLSKEVLLRDLGHSKPEIQTQVIFEYMKLRKEKLSIGIYCR